MIFATCDTHGGFQRFSQEHFPQQRQMNRDDYMIILGDYAAKNIMPKLFILHRKSNNLKTFLGIVFLVL